MNREQLELRAPGTDDQPASPRRRSGLIAAGCLLACALIAAVAYLGGTR